MPSVSLPLGPLAPALASVISCVQVQEALFEGPEEAALWAAYQQVAGKVPRDADGRTFAEASLLLQKPLDDFFTNVFVMAVSPARPGSPALFAAFVLVHAPWGVQSRREGGYCGSDRCRWALCSLLGLECHDL